MPISTLPTCERSYTSTTPKRFHDRARRSDHASSTKGFWLIRR